MKAVIYDEFRSVPEVRTVSDPEAPEGSVVLEVLACGICRSDWHGWMGDDPDISLPHVPGHEIAGRIAELGKGIEGWKVGDLVTVPFVCGCGQCRQCESGNQQVCDKQFQPGFTHWGAFAEFVEIRYAEENLVALPEGLDPVTAASLGCRFMTAFRAIVHQGMTKPGDWVSVFGCGGVGLSAILIGKAIGARVVAVDIAGDKLELAEQLGADACVNSARESVVKALKDLTDGGPEVSIDAIGHPEVAKNSILGLRKRGKHIQVGLLGSEHSDTEIPLNHFVANEIELLGSHGMQAHKYGEMFELIAGRKLDPKKLVGRKVRLGEAPVVLTEMDRFEGRGIAVIDEFR
ncbi:MAG: alcohol dehydrogenase [Acidobacteria bacterium]|nr:MAG: alcohol dehydrogenase [Acidobacteriota bacterium]REK04203.1 MAG: alcohol dehydrogenase [Acidobacteriota bacterium]REK15365.1 MAG: alcohol dehydrogenase [Acidobacteriota bacterium]REK46455.1 MAG: alcohol dehydrogenase [Acidobacteriota bacterium]